MQRNPRLNFLSPDFDPEEALSTTDHIVLPFPSVPLLDNLAQCRRLLPPSSSAAVKVELHLKPGSKHAEAARLASSDGHSTSHAAESSQTEARPSLAHQWANSFKEGPLSMLRALQRQHVRVVVRRQHGVRSVCEGRLALFDRHLNLVLLRVTESAVIQPEPIRQDESTPWPEAIWERRSIGQLLIRGDCVVCISAALKAPQPGPAKEALRRIAQDAARRAIFERIAFSEQDARPTSSTGP
ncbi:hypothetical protein AB1Y20_019162 [Prymnesium parvum]|uniref:Sm domain-containing protein n=1 Tax=Prymnesium parvum TaxID=97485 RepID=A0AB34JV03_PRYPA